LIKLLPKPNIPHERHYRENGNPVINFLI